jgi:hypothetical protein
MEVGRRWTHEPRYSVEPLFAVMRPLIGPSSASWSGPLGSPHGSPLSHALAMLFISF